MESAAVGGGSFVAKVDGGCVGPVAGGSASAFASASCRHADGDYWRRAISCDSLAPDVIGFPRPGHFFYATLSWSAPKGEEDSDAH